MNDPYSVAGRVDDFDKRHGRDSVSNGQWVFYKSGAVREVDPLGALIEPRLDDAYEHAKNVLQYYQLKLRRAVQAFDAFRSQLLMSTVPDRDSVEELKRLKSVVEEKSAEHEAAKQRLAETPEAKRRAESKQFDIEQKQALEAYKQDVKEVRV